MDSKWGGYRAEECSGLRRRERERIESIMSLHALFVPTTQQLQLFSSLWSTPHEIGSVCIHTFQDIDLKLV